MQIFNKNINGRDWVVGDIHGNFSKLSDLLIEVGFDFDKDRLFCTGDLVDRGPESHLALDWIAYDWFFTVMGNHEDMAIGWAYDKRTPGAQTPYIYGANGGEWFMNFNTAKQKMFADVFKQLPRRIQINDADGNPDVGIIHAEAPEDWLKPDTDHTMLWSRDRIQYKDIKGTANIRKVYLGHTPLQSRTTLGNNIYIDTGACFRNGFFTLEVI